VQGEFVRHSGAGFVAESADDWSRAVKQLAGDAALRREMGAAGRRFVHEFYSTTIWAPELVGMLNSLVGPTGSGPIPQRLTAAVVQPAAAHEPVGLSL
jgi:hypothetical protein